MSDWTSQMSRFHWTRHFSRADWGGKFMVITKKSWLDVHRKLDRDDHAIICFRELGVGPILTELVNGDLPPQVKGLE